MRNTKGESDVAIDPSLRLMVKTRNLIQTEFCPLKVNSQYDHESPDEAYCQKSSENRIKVPRDAMRMCSIIGFFMEHGLLPRTAEAVAEAGLGLIDAGAAFGGEVMVGHELG
jgi:hypothetical protein